MVLLSDHACVRRPFTDPDEAGGRGEGGGGRFHLRGCDRRGCSLIGVLLSACVKGHKFEKFALGVVMPHGARSMTP